MLQAALEVLDDDGLPGFTMEAVARRAGASKATLYRRWPTKERLITAALTMRIPPPETFDTGTLRGDLLAVARHTLQTALDGSGLTEIRLALESFTGEAPLYAALRPRTRTCWKKSAKTPSTI